jgi:hypothetical protein
VSSSDNGAELVLIPQVFSPAFWVAEGYSSNQLTAFPHPLPTLNLRSGAQILNCIKIAIWFSDLYADMCRIQVKFTKWMSGNRWVGLLWGDTVRWLTPLAPAAYSSPPLHSAPHNRHLHTTTTIINNQIKLLKLHLDLSNKTSPFYNSIYRILYITSDFRLRVIQSTRLYLLKPHPLLSPRSTLPSKVYHQARPSKILPQSEEQIRVLLVLTTSLT